MNESLLRHRLGCVPTTRLNLSPTGLVMPFCGTASKIRAGVALLSVTPYYSQCSSRTRSTALLDMQPQRRQNASSKENAGPSKRYCCNTHSNNTTICLIFKLLRENDKCFIKTHQYRLCLDWIHTGVKSMNFIPAGTKCIALFNILFVYT